MSTFHKNQTAGTSGSPCLLSQRYVQVSECWNVNPAEGRCWRYNPVVDCLPSVYMALSLALRAALRVEAMDFDLSALTSTQTNPSSVHFFPLILFVFYFIYSLFTFIYLYFMYVFKYFACMYVSTPHACSVHGGQKRILIPWNLS